MYGLRQQLGPLLTAVFCLNNGLSRSTIKLVEVLVVYLSEFAVILLEHGVEFLTWLIFLE